MAQTIKLKRSGTQNAVPSTSQLALGEVALNTYDGKMYIKKSVGGAESIVEIGGDATSSSGLDFTGNLNLADNVRIVIGDGNDLQIYHDGSDSYITDGGTGNLKIQADDLVFKTADGSKEYLKGTASGSVRIRHNNSTKLETTSSGISVTGDVTADTATSTQVPLSIGGSSATSFALQRWITSAHSGSEAYIIAYGAGHASQAGNFAIKNLEANSDIFFELANGVEPLRLTSSGVTVTGVLAADQLKVGATERIYLDGGSNTFIVEDAADDLGIYVGGSRRLRVNTARTVAAGDLQVEGGDIEFTQSSGQARIRNLLQDTYMRFQVNVGGTQTNAINIRGNNAYVGIGSAEGGSNPVYPLDVYAASADTVARFTSGDNKARLLLADNDTEVFVIAEGSKMSLGFASSLSSTNLTIDPDGRLGIGVTDFSSALRSNGKQLIIGSCFVGTGAALVADDFARFGGAIYIHEDAGTNKANLTAIDNNGVRLVITGKGGTTNNALDAPDGFYVGGTQFITSSRNLTNIGTISSGTITSSTGTVGTSPNTFKIVTSTEANTAQGDVYAALEFHVTGAETSTGTLSDSAISAIKAIDYRSGTTSFEDAGLGFYTVASTDSAPVFRGGFANAGGLFLSVDGNVDRNTGAGDLYADSNIEAANNLTFNNQFKKGSNVIINNSSELLINTVNITDGDFVVLDNNNTGELNIIWRDHSADRLYLGTTQDVVEFRGNVNFQSGHTLSHDGNVILDSSRNLTNITTITSGNITTTGYLRGPSTFTIDPAAHGDDTGTVVIAGNLQVDGTTTTINSTTLTVDDKNITLASGAANAAAANGAGLTVDCGSDTDATFIYDGTNDAWSFNKDVGIGTSAPGAKLHILQTAETFNDGIKLVGSSGPISGRIYMNGEHLHIDNATAGANTGLTLDDNGNVGIGNANPNFSLDISGADNSQLRLLGTDTNPTTLVMDYNSGGATGRVRIQNDDGDLKFTTNNGNVRQTILENGNVGIGTTSPSTPLHISSTSTSTLTLQNTTNAGNAALHFRDESNVDQYKVYYDMPNNKAYQTFNGNGLTFYSAQISSEVAKIGYGNGYNTSYFAGNVGIGTTSPGRKLTVQGASGDNLPLRIIGGSGTNHGSMEFQDPNTTADYKVAIGSKADDFYIQAGGTEKVRVLANGNVGIGTTSPSGSGSRKTLHIDSTSNGSAIRLSQNDSGALFRYDTTNGLKVGTITTEALTLQTNDTTRIKIAATGEVTFNEAFTLPTTDGSTNQVLKTDGSGNVTWATEAAVSANTSISDADGDTKIQVEESSDEDKIRFDVAGSQLMQISSNGVGINEQNIDALLHLSHGSLPNIKLERPGTKKYTIGITGTDFRIDGISDNLSTPTFTINSSGNVGIGTTAPIEKLDVSGYQGISVNANYAHMGSTVSGAMAIFGHNIKSDSANNTIKTANNGYHSSMIKMYYNEGITFHATSGTQSAGDAFYDISGTTNELMRITNAGNVGIGTSSPSEKLEVNGRLKVQAGDAATSAYSIISNGGDLVLKAGADDVVLRTGGSGSEGIYFQDGAQDTKMFINAENGNVGIGTTSPDTKLDITTTGVHGLIINQDTSNANVSSRLFFKDSTRTNLIMNVSGRLEFRTDGTIGSTSGTYKVGVTPTLLDVTTPIRIEETEIGTSTTSTSATAQVAIDAISATVFRSVRYTIQVTNSTDSTYHLTEILLIHDGTTPAITEFGTIFTGSAEATFDADISSGNVRLLATPASTDSMTFKVVRHCITV